MAFESVSFASVSKLSVFFDFCMNSVPEWIHAMAARSKSGRSAELFAFARISASGMFEIGIWMARLPSSVMRLSCSMPNFSSIAVAIFSRTSGIAVGSFILAHSPLSSLVCRALPVLSSSSSAAFCNKSSDGSICRTSGTMPCGMCVSASSVQRRMAQPFCVRPLRPLRWIAFCSEIGRVRSTFTFLLSSYSFTRSIPLSTTPVTFGTVMDVSAMLVVKMTRGRSVSSKMRSCVSRS